MFKKLLSSFMIVAMVVVSSGILSPYVANAASITSFSDVVTDLTASTATNHTITFTTPTGVTSGQTIILTFDNSTSINSSFDYTDVDIKDDGTDLPIAASPSGATWGAVRTSALVVTLTNGTTAVTAGSVIEIQLGTHATYGTTGTHQITNGSAGTTILAISGTFTDTGSLAMPIVSNGVVAIAATVLPTISFALSDNTIFFGNLRTAGACFAQGTDPGNVTCPTTSETEAFNATVATNAANGYTLSVRGATLTSGANTITALGSNTASSPSTEQFGIRATASGGSGTVSAPYAASGYAYTADASTATTVATSSTSSATTTYSVRVLANIASTTEAGSYTTNHYWVATGNF